MGLPAAHLHPNEQIVVDLHPHWWFMASRTLLLVAAMALGGVALAVQPEGTFGTVVGVAVALVILAALGAFLLRLLEWRSTNFVVTTDRCIYRAGVFAKTGVEIPLERINTVFFNQSVGERLLKAGDLGIESAGEFGRQTFSDIKDPVLVQNMIYRQIEENENRKYDRIGGEARQAAEAAAGSTLSVAEQLEKLADLRDRGVITSEEFEAQKARLLGA